ncbi:MAG: tRNA-dihydrouridine synthase [Candidatus Buchananbacteria bacterium]
MTGAGRPILALAPMAGISDSAFRQICRKSGADVVYTEMVSADGLYYDSKKTLEFLKFAKSERPVVIQLFGKHPAVFTKAAQIAEKAGFDGIDINFGCPAKKVAGHGGGVTLMRDLDKCREIIEAVMAGTNLPVSVKLRTSIIKPPLAPPFVKGEKNSGRNFPPLYERGGQEGFNVVTSLDFIKAMKDLPIAAIMIHGRSYEKPFDGEIDYEMIKKCVHEFKKHNPDGTVLGNGGIKKPEDAKIMIEKTGCDGVGLARGVYGKPWLFKQVRDYLKTGKCKELTQKQIVKVILEHAKMAFGAKGGYGLIELRKHLLWYVSGWPQAKQLRSELVKVEKYGDLRQIFKV